MKELNTIQSRLKAPKGQYNRFGGYRYRSCEDILEAVKPLLGETGCTLTIADEVLPVGNRIYIRATATLTNGAGEKESTTALAREEEVKKGMDAAQITGSASSYARKYALNGLFCIDDTKDPDSTNTHGQQAAQPAAPAQPQQPAADEAQAIAQVSAAQDEEVLNSIVRASKALWNSVAFQEATKKRRLEIQNNQKPQQQ